MNNNYPHVVSAMKRNIQNGKSLNKREYILDINSQGEGKVNGEFISCENVAPNSCFHAEPTACEFEY